MTEALLKTGQHVVTAITRVDSKSSLREGVAVKAVDYERLESLVEALCGQDALVITISGQASIQKLEEMLLTAAGDAGAPWMYAGSLINTLFPARQGLLVDESLPNEWSPDTAHEGIVKDTPWIRHQRFA